MLAGISASTALAQTDVCKSYNRAGLSYQNFSLVEREHYADENETYWESAGAFNGFGLYYAHGFGLTSNYPLYLEVGGNINFLFRSLYDGDVQDSNINLTIPLNLTYHFNITNTWVFAPYLGINAKVNLLGQSKLSYEDDTYTTNWYNKKDMGNCVYNRFQMGWQIGAGFYHSNYYIGFDYGKDLIPASKDKDDDDWSVQTSNLTLTLGYRF